jgi:hypothetical protein
VQKKGRPPPCDSRPSREWLKTKCSEFGKFVITGFRDSTPGEIEAVTVAEIVDDKLLPAGEVQFGVGRRLCEAESQQPFEWRHE